MRCPRYPHLQGRRAKHRWPWQPTSLIAAFSNARRKRVWSSSPPRTALLQVKEHAGAEVVRAASERSGTGRYCVDPALGPKSLKMPRKIRFRPDSLRTMFLQIDKAWGIALIGVTGAVVGGFVGGLSPLIVAWWFGPQLLIDFQENENNRIDDSDFTWIRARVQNKGHRRATNCQAFITAIYEIRADNSLHPVAKDSKVLQWAGGSVEPRSVPHGVEFYVDLLRVSRVRTGWGIIHEIYPNQQKLQSYSGTYQFHVMISGDKAAPFTCKINVDYKQEWSSLRAWRV